MGERSLRGRRLDGRFWREMVSDVVTKLLKVLIAWIRCCVSAVTNYNFYLNNSNYSVGAPPFIVRGLRPPPPHPHPPPYFSYRVSSGHPPPPFPSTFLIGLELAPLGYATAWAIGIQILWSLPQMAPFFFCSGCVTRLEIT